MIIVSQEKNRIINFNNILNLYISRYEKEKITEYYISYEDCNNSYEDIGCYETKERAKEVLQEIWKFYEISKRYECSSNNGITIFLEPKFAYQMPEK